MQITNDMLAEDQINALRAHLRVRSNVQPDFWLKSCEGGDCTAKTTHFVVGDEYFATVRDAMDMGTRYHIYLCRVCYKSQAWRGALTLLSRPRVSLIKRIQCTHGYDNACPRAGAVFIQNQSGKRRWFCVNHGSIHSQYTEMLRVNAYGIVINVTDDMSAFYTSHVQAGIIRRAQ